jgi:hypothetical protein
MVKFGAKLSSPRPIDPYKKNSASRYSKFKGNSSRSISDCGIGESLDPSVMNGEEQEIGTRKRIREAIIVAMVVEVNSSAIFNFF